MGYKIIALSLVVLGLLGILELQSCGSSDSTSNAGSSTATIVGGTS